MAGADGTMTPHQHADGDGGAGEAALASLRQAEAHLRQMTEQLRGQAAEVAELRAQLTGVRDHNEDLTGQCEEGKRALEQALAAECHQEERARLLAEGLKDIHRALFSNNIYELLLRVCATITGASRGLYITMRDRADVPRVRAAIEVDGYPASLPSEFITALSRQVLDAGESLVFTSAADLDGLPKPERLDERFNGFIAALVVLLHDLSGVVIVADKLHGQFSDADAQALVNVGDQDSVAMENRRLRHDLQEAYRATVTVLADAMEAKDSYTQGHCDTVSRYARHITEHLNLPEAERSVVLYAALLHDIGKIAVSDGILNKPGPLLAEERELIKSHVRIGHDLIRHVPVLAQVAQVVLHHHESYDGSGYPDGLTGEEIPIGSRIVGTVDAYCAMITKRSYKDAYSDEWARNELRRCAGTQFDPRVVEIFLGVLDEPAAETEPDDVLDALLPGFHHLGAQSHMAH